MDKNKGALAGIKVVDFGRVATVPWLTSIYFGSWGADVVRIESHKRLEVQRLAKPYKDGIVSVNHSGFYARHNSSKYCVSFDFTKPKGKELTLKLFKWADIACDGLAPGTLDKYGLNYEGAKAVNPGIIFLTTSMLGSGGPFSNFGAYGHQAAALAGLDHFTGWPDSPPSAPWGAYTDYIGPRVIAAIVLAALDYRRRTGIGQHIDVSQVEAGILTVAPMVTSYGKTKHPLTRNGNHVDGAAPHNAYPCKGEDRWVAIAVFTDEEWDAFCRAIGEPDWCRHTKFATLRERKRHEDELDTHIASWTKDFTAEQIAGLMQSYGVASMVVESVADVFCDPQLAHRGHFTVGKHSVMGEYYMDAPASRLSLTPHHQFAAPALGEHNEYVFKEILRLSDDDIADLIIDGVITTEADLPEIKAAV